MRVGRRYGRRGLHRERENQENDRGHDRPQHHENDAGRNAPCATGQRGLERRYLERVEPGFEVLCGFAIRAHIQWTRRISPAFIDGGDVLVTAAAV